MKYLFLNNRTWFFLLFVIFSRLDTTAQTQRVKIKFGDIKPEDFASAFYSIDSSANAVYLFDGGSTYFMGNNKGYFSVYTKIHERIRLLNKKSFDDLATVKIPLAILNSSNEQQLQDFQASTFNIDNGKVVETKVDKNSLFKDKSENVITEKFTFPNIKEGSIIEYTFAILTPVYYYLMPWRFQGEYPRLYSEFEVTIPEFYDFVSITQGYHGYDIDSTASSSNHYTVIAPNGTGPDDILSFQAQTNYHLWAMKNVPALKEEKYITTLGNYNSKIEFQLSAIRYPDQPVERFMNNWMTEALDLMKNDDFGADLNKSNSWMNDDLKKVTAGSTDEIDKAKKIYTYVRDNFNCIDYDDRELSQSLKKVFETRKGNVADINLLLTAMYINRGFDAKPVILSTRDHGKASELYPIMSKFNYVVTRLKINDEYYFLDAADNRLGFNRLSTACYNGSGRLIDSLPELVQLSADSLKESKITSVFIINGDKGLEGSFTSNLGYFESLHLRDKLSKMKQDDLFKEIQKNYSSEINISNTSLDSLKLLDNPISVKYDMDLNLGNDDIIYFNPMLSEAYKDNPFQSANRSYPVEMPYSSDETYIFNMETPKGYTIDELPKSVKVSLNETDGMFEYIIARSDDGIQLRCRLQLNKANFAPEDYQTLRDFFAYVVKKEDEQIVFKKIK
jgi:hypothetical protein